MKTSLIIICCVLLVVGSLLFWQQPSKLANVSVEPITEPRTTSAPEIVKAEKNQQRNWPGKDKNGKYEQRLYDDYISELAAGDKIRQLITDLDELSDEQKQQQVEKLLAGIDAKLADKQISNGEALYLQLALMKYILPREEYLEYADNLTQQQQQLVDNKWKNYQANRDPAFIEYKQREKILVAEILKMDSYPNGMTRDEYLRYKLDELKQEVYAVTP